MQHDPGKAKRQRIIRKRSGNGGGTARPVSGSVVDQSCNTLNSGETAHTPQYLALSGKGVPLVKRSCLSHEAVGKRFQQINTILAEQFCGGSGTILPGGMVTKENP